jgi:6-pyruvoyltetrahydropterin/6-carboxytetrahydropterin synthase
MKVTVCRQENFNAAHRLFNPSWTDEKNAAVFGLCSNPSYHGHNYRMVVKLTGNVDPETGYVYDLKKLSDIIKAEILDKFDHRNLNLDVEAFKTVNPTAENIVMVIWQLLRAKIDPQLALSVTLFETEKNFAEYNG